MDIAFPIFLVALVIAAVVLAIMDYRERRNYVPVKNDPKAHVYEPPTRYRPVPDEWGYVSKHPELTYMDKLYGRK